MSVGSQGMSGDDSSYESAHFTQSKCYCLLSVVKVKDYRVRSKKVKIRSIGEYGFKCC